MRKRRSLRLKTYDYTNGGRTYTKNVTYRDIIGHRKTPGRTHPIKQGAYAVAGLGISTAYKRGGKRSYIGSGIHRVTRRPARYVRINALQVARKAYKRIRKR